MRSMFSTVVTMAAFRGLEGKVVLFKSIIVLAFLRLDTFFLQLIKLILSYKTNVLRAEANNLDIVLKEN